MGQKLQTRVCDAIDKKSMQRLIGMDRDSRFSPNVAEKRAARMGYAGKGARAKARYYTKHHASEHLLCEQEVEYGMAGVQRHGRKGRPVPTVPNARKVQCTGEQAGRIEDKTYKTRKTKEI